MKDVDIVCIREYLSVLYLLGIIGIEELVYVCIELSFGVGE
jgi:hypothetical protein